eukprot:3937960-Rhodomonas_salina.1
MSPPRFLRPQPSSSLLPGLPDLRFMPSHTPLSLGVHRSAQACCCSASHPSHLKLSRLSS